MESEHPEYSVIRQLLAGDLPDTAADALLEHLGGCEICFALAESAWPDLSSRPRELELIPPLPGKTSEGIERQVLRRIHLASSTRVILLLLLGGFVQFVSALVRPASRHHRNVD